MMGIFRSIAGMVTVELTSADIAGSLASITALNIPIFDVQLPGELTAVFQIFRRDFRRVRDHAKRRGERLTLVRQRGIYWTLKGLLHRPVLLTTILLLFILAVALPSRVLFVEVEGNKTIPTKLILAAAEDCGIRFGASRKEVRSEKMKNALLSAVPELQWAGVNTYGCVAVISVRERSASEKAETESDVSSIAASRDGVILSCTVTSGNGLCTVGQAVAEGDILISGYTDCGLCITATRAEGEIFALTNRNLTAKTPSEVLIRSEVQSENSKISLVIGKKRINFYKGSGISDGSCVKMYSKYVLTLPGGFELPIALEKETVISYHCIAEEVSQEKAFDLLTGFAARYLQKQMIAGSILNRAEELSYSDGTWCLTGEYACTEMIGKRQKEQIGVIP